MTELPRIISVDDHVIEPAHLFETWLPAKYRDRGPKPLTAGIGELAYIGGKYQITMDPDGPPTDWWIYEDLKFPYKRNIAAVGFDRDEMTLEGITREEMRRGCWDPAERLEDMDLNHVEALALLPDLPALLRPDLRRGARQGGRARLRARLQRLDGRGVVRRQRRPAHPAVPHPAVGHRPRRRGDPAQRRAGRAGRDLQRDPHPPRAAQSIHSGYWDPFFAVCEETGTVVNMHIGSSSQMPAASPDAPPAVQASLSLQQRHGLDDGLPLQRRPGEVPAAQTRLQRGPDGLDPLRPGARRRRLGGAPGLGRRARPDPRAAVHLLLPADLLLLLPRQARRRRRSTWSAATTPPSRPTTRTSTRPSRTPRRSPSTM